MILELKEILIDLKNVRTVWITEGYDKGIVTFCFENKKIMEVEVKLYDDAVRIKNSCSRLMRGIEDYEWLGINII